MPKFKDHEGLRSLERALLKPSSVAGSKEPTSKPAAEGLAMRIKKESDITQIQELDYIAVETCSGALSNRLLARIARRPGRWRQRMQSRRATQEDEMSFYDEAA